jgi:hypothetical protein
MQFLILATAATVFASPLDKRNNYQYQPSTQKVPQYQQTAFQCPSGFVGMNVTMIEERTWLIRTAQRMYFVDKNKNCLFEWKHTFWGFRNSETRGQACVIDKYATLVNKKEKAELVNVRGISYQLNHKKENYVTVDLAGPVLRTGNGHFRPCGKGWRS